MTDIELTLPEADGFMETFDTYGCPVGFENAWGEKTVKETIRANVAHATAAKDAEIERLRAEVCQEQDYAASAARRVLMAQLAQRRAEAHAEQLAKALREVVELDEEDGDSLRNARAISRAALRDHDQEGGDA